MRRRIKKAAIAKSEAVNSSLLEEEDDGPSIFDDEVPLPSERAQHFSKLAKVGKEFDGFRPASEAMSIIKAVPTCFVQYDHGTKVGGHPTERISLLHGPSGEGKALTYETELLTPTGWQTMGRICVGDFVIAGDGTPTEVLGVYPQGPQNVFRVTFDDGTWVECCEEHLWFTTTIKERARGRYVRGPRPNRSRISTGVEGHGSVKSLAEIREGFVPRDHSIPIAGVAQFEPLGDLPLDPYLLGLYLGDGGSSGTAICFHKPEKDVQKSFAERLPEGDDVVKEDKCTVRIRGNRLRKQLKLLGLHGKRSWEKFVPELYLMAGPEDRLELLKGLLDTDGSVVKDGGAVEYATASFELADDVAFIARSLGAYVTSESRQTSFTYKGEKKKGRPSRRLRIYFNDDTVPIRSEKHLSKWKGRNIRRQFRSIVSIEPSRVAKTVCIRVKHPERLFVVKDFIVTHNTYFTLGEMKSFLILDNPTLFIDAERTTDKGFAKLALAEMSLHPFFFYERPTTYEEVVAKVRKWCNIVKRLRDDGKIHEDACGLIVVDSIRKMVPADQWNRILELEKAAKGAKPEKLRDRSAQIKALMNAAWCDELVPLLEQTGCTMIIIARETDDPDAQQQSKIFGTAYKTGGGKALYYDASLDIRVERAKYITKDMGEGVRPIVYGERHRITIKKSKIGGKEDKSIVCYFHTSNGVLIPAGFDRARDVLELARRFEIVTVPPPKKEKKGVKKKAAGGGGWMMWNSNRWQGEHNAVKALTADAKLLEGLEREVREKFAIIKPIEHDDNGVVSD